MLRLLSMVLTVVMLLMAPAALLSQEATPQAVEQDAAAKLDSTTDMVPVEPDRAATGGAQTLEDILRRQAGQKVDERFRSDNIGGNAINTPEMAPLGGSSDAEMWRALRFDKADIQSTTRNPAGKVLIQDGGMSWLQFRQGPLITWGGLLLLGTIVLLALFYLIRGRVRLDAPTTGRTVIRFRAFERFAHWLLAISFILQALTGLTILLGRWFIAPYLGKDINATLLRASSYVHDNVGWAFIVGLVLVFVLWAMQNIPGPSDVKWFLQGGGIFGKKHPPARKFNGGQKVLFWIIILLGGSVALSGVSLLFPFEMPLFAKTFGVLNSLGFPDLLGMNQLPTPLPPQEEMQLAQAWHAIVAFVLMAIIIAHIYIGTLGMEGAFDAMGKGEVDEAWAEQHHALWLDEVRERESDPASGTPTPAE